MNGLDFCQNPKNLNSGPFIGTFWALMTNWNLFFKIELRHFSYFMTI